MILGIDGKPWFDLEPYININSLALQKPMISAALAATHHMRFPSILGSQKNLHDQSLLELWDYAKKTMSNPAYEHINILRALSDRSKIHLFFKYMYDVVTLNEAIHLRVPRKGDYFKKHISSHCVDTPAFQHFRFLREWIEAQDIFSEYGRIVFFINEPYVPSIMHKDYPDGNSRKDNFIWITIDGRKKFWIFDNDSKEKYYITSRAVIFDNADWHGGDSAKYISWSLRIDGVFSDRFLDRTGLKTWYKVI